MSTKPINIATITTHKLQVKAQGFPEWITVTKLIADPFLHEGDPIQQLEQLYNALYSHWPEHQIITDINKRITPPLDTHLTTPTPNP